MDGCAALAADARLVWSASRCTGSPDAAPAGLHPQLFQTSYTIIAEIHTGHAITNTTSAP